MGMVPYVVICRRYLWARNLELIILARSYSP
jgi:hypothetical protein